MSKETPSRSRHHVRQARTFRARPQVELLESRDVPSAATDYVPGELLVKFKPGVDQTAIRNFCTAHGLAEKTDLDAHAATGTGHLKLVNVPAGQTEALVPELERDPRVDYAEPNYVVTNAAAAVTPTDPFYVTQYHLHNTGQWSSTSGADIHATEAWNVTTGSPNVLVAVIDGGVDYTHPDLAANMWTNPNEIPGDGIDNDGDGYVDDIHGINTLNNSGDPMPDPNGVGWYHGTHVAGIIGAAPYGEMTVGVAWRVGIIAVRLIDSDNTVKVSNAVQAFQYLNYLKNVEHQNIVAANNSWTWDGLARSRAARDAMAGLDQPGMDPILQVCAAGNSNNNNDLNPVYPSSYDLPNIISVAATDWNDQYTDFTNFGATSVDLAAPGYNIVSTTPLDRFDALSGTSQAAPQVTGAAALVASAFPGLTTAQIKQRILDGVDPIGQIGDNSLKPTVTNGRLNVANALAGAAPANDTQAPTAVGNLTAAATTFQSVTLTWTATGDDGTAGQAAFYDLRYATSPITNATWDAATRVLGELDPKPAGSTEFFTVTGLDPIRTYYFALKVRDDQGNLSTQSNVASGATTAAATLFSDNVETGLNGWTASGLWHQSTARASSPTMSWYYGLEATHTYDTGAANSGTLTSPVIDLRGSTHPVLIYREWRQVEDVNTLDHALVQISTQPYHNWETLAQSELSTSLDPLNWQGRLSGLGWSLTLQSPDNTPQWVSRALDLSAFEGKRIQVRFVFDTTDAAFNDYEGWYVDDVNVYDGPASSTHGAAGAATGGANILSATPSTGSGNALAAFSVGWPTAVGGSGPNQSPAISPAVTAIAPAMAGRELLFALLATEGQRNHGLRLGLDAALVYEDGSAGWQALDELDGLM
jgi:subtilisin family serine protease